MKLKKIMIILGMCIFALSFTGCGQAASDDDEITADDEPDDDSEDDADNDKDKKGGLKDLLNGKKSSHYDEDFDVYKYYEPDSLITNSVLSDGAYVQIGDSVMELGKSTLSDFVNAGVDLYATKAELAEYYEHPSRDKDLNDKFMQNYIDAYKEDGSVIFPGYLSGDIRVDLSSFGRTLEEEDPDDPIIDSVMFEPYAGNYGWPSDFTYGGPKYRDIDSIYVTGGIKFTGPVSTIPDTYGKSDLDEHGEKEGHEYWSRVFLADSPDPDFIYYFQVLSRDDHCSSLLIKLKDSPNRPIVREDTLKEILRSYAIRKCIELDIDDPYEYVDDYLSYQAVRSKEMENGKYMYYAAVYIYRTFGEILLIDPYGTIYEYGTDYDKFDKYNDLFNADISSYDAMGDLKNDPTYIEYGYEFESGYETEDGSQDQDRADSGSINMDNLSKWPGFYKLDIDENYTIEVMDTYTDGTIYFSMTVMDASGTSKITNEYNVEFSNSDCTEFTIPYQSGINEVFKLEKDGISVSLDNGMNGANDGFYKRTASY